MKLPATPPSLSELGEGGIEKILALNVSGIGKLPEDKYLHWTKLRYLEPPEGFSSEDWWLAIKLARVRADTSSRSATSTDGPSRIPIPGICTACFTRSIAMPAGGSSSPSTW